MTTLNFALSQALVRQLAPGDTVLITELDHEANRGPWLQLQDRGIEVLDVAIDVDTCTLDMNDLQAKLLKYLDDHEVMRLGGTKSKKIDAIVIAATNQNIEKLVGEKFKNKK